MTPRTIRSHGFALLPVVLTLALLGVVTALLLESGAVEHGIRENRQRADALVYTAEAGYAHARGATRLAQRLFRPANIARDVVRSGDVRGHVNARCCDAEHDLLIRVVADSWLESAAANAAHATDNDLKTQNKAGSHYRPVLRFDLSGLPANVDILVATLNLEVKNDDNSGDPVEIYRMTSTWSEAAVTWGNASTNYDGAWRQGSFTPIANGPISIDLTRLVRAWTDGALPNFGVYLIATSNDEDSVYESREEGDATKRPRIVVTTRPRVSVAVAAQATSADGVQRTVSASADGPASSALALDYFNAGYAGDDGTRSWGGNWQETGESNGPSSGAIRVVASGTCAYGNCLRLDAGLLSTISAWREVNLLGATIAELRVDTRRDGGNWTLQVSGNGGSSWQTLKSVGAGTDSKQVRDIFNVSSYATANMQVRFTSSQLFGPGAKDVYIDNVEVEAACVP